MTLVERPIGVFDSGIGGLTVAREIMRALPGERIVYLGDTARVPYGVRSARTVRRYAVEGVEFLRARNIKLLVVACNTISAVGLDAVERAASVPVVGVIEPGARAALGATRNGRIGVIGTEATVRSEAYTNAIRALRPDAEVFARACPLFVPLVEEGWIGGEVPERVAETYLAGLRTSGIDTLVLGCTHYPLLKPVIGKVMGEGIVLIDSAHETSLLVREMLGARGEASAGGAGRPRHEFCVTDSPGRFRAVGEGFLGEGIGDVNHVTLEAIHDEV
jgi:glutamate racemase